MPKMHRISFRVELISGENHGATGDGGYRKSRLEWYKIKKNGDRERDIGSEGVGDRGGGKNIKVK